MKISYIQITEAIEAALARHGLAGAEPSLTPIEPPRPWGVTTNVCFRLAGKVAQEEIAFRTEGLSKKEAKQLAGQITKEAGLKLAEELTGELSNAMQQAAAEGAILGPLPFIERVEAEGAYVNFYYSQAALTEYVVSTAVREGDSFGHGLATHQRIMVEYAQPNTHKDFHVGHLRNASIGQAIANLVEFAGNDVLKATYIGDVGAHVAKAIWGHQHRNQPDWVEYFPKSNLLADSENKLLYWGSCYRETETLLSSGGAKLAPDEMDAAAMLKALLPAKIKKEMGKWLGAWEAGDLAARVEWQNSRDDCDEAFRQIFAELELAFDKDYLFYESTVDDTKLGQQTAEELKARGIAVVDESEEYKGALYVDFAEQVDALKPDGTPVFRDDEKKRIKKLGKMTILRSDGTSLYQTKELGLAKHKFDVVRAKYGQELGESLYVVGAEQKLYFQQVLAILRLWGFPNAENCRHISYELVVLPEGKMSSREGTIVSYRELRDEAIKRATQITREKGIGAKGDGDAVDEAKVKQIARDVAIAAIKYTMLKVTGNQQIVFDFEEALSFSGRSAPYLQYAYARARKLVGANPVTASSGGVSPPESNGDGRRDAAATHAAIELTHEPHASEVELARQLSVYPSVCAEAAANHEPATLCTYLYELANTFSAFYRDCRVLDAPESEKQFRQTLARAFTQVMASGFKLLALPLPEEM